MSHTATETTLAGKADDATTIVTGGAGKTIVRTNKDLGQLERDISHYPEPIRTDTSWMQGFFLDHCDANIHTLRAIAAKLGHDKSPEYFRNVINGDQFTNKPSSWKRGGQAWSAFSEMVLSLRRYSQAAARTGQMPFVQTPTYHAMANFITAKRALSAVCKIGGIVAPTGSQTSESFRFYQALNNHGAVIHLEAPASGRLTELEIKVAEQYHVLDTKIRHRAGTRRMAIRENVNNTRCIIIDNCQVLYDPRHGNQQPTFNWIRELYDDRRPTFILKFTQEFFDDHLKAGAAKGYFEQFIGRMGGLNGLLRLPDYTPAADLEAIARAFQLDPGKTAMEYLHEWSRAAGRVRIVFEKLQLARSFAQADKRTRITLDDLGEADQYTPPTVGEDCAGGAA